MARLKGSWNFDFHGKFCSFWAINAFKTKVSSSTEWFLWLWFFKLALYGKVCLSKIDPIFVNVALLHFKIIETLLNLLLNFVSPTLKLHNQYCPSSKRVKNLSLHWVTFCVICLWKILGTLFNLVSVRLWDFKDGGS